MPSIGILPDVIDENTKLLICGEKAGQMSAEAKCYYVNPSNKFWKTLCRVGLTDRVLSPHEYREVLKYGIGLTDLIKGGVDKDTVKCTDADRVRLENLIAEYKPKILAFTGKSVAKQYSTENIRWGNTGKRIHGAAVWVVPSTSGGNGHYERLFHHWADLAKAVKALKTAK